ncbi:MAG: glycerate kinase, partial [Desulfarculaceae bacterium]
MSEQVLREHARAVFDSALKAVDPAAAVKAALRLEGNALQAGNETLDLSRFSKVVVVGAGKAGAPMAAALEEVLGGRIDSGLVVVKYDHSGPTQTVEICEASHPVPDAQGEKAGNRIAALVDKNADPGTLFFCLLSGGGSALLVSPAQGLSLADKQETTRLLLACGAEIGEINTIRKHLSRIKGGNLARMAAPGRLISLIISDVVGDRLDVIASGPTVFDNSTWEDCREILDRYKIWSEVPGPVRRRIQEGLDGALADTPKPGDQALAGVSNYIIASNRQALTHASAQAEALGYRPLILSSTIEGETKEIARMHAAMAREIVQTGHPLEPPCCLISGGETTVTLSEDHGLGGRNQEFALAAALDLADLPGVLVLSAGTDGTDGPTDAAGAQADGRTVARARELGLDPRRYLQGNDAYHFFQALDDLVVTGPTLTNVMDVR